MNRNDISLQTSNFINHWCCWH